MTFPRKAMVLAAGLGTRMSPLTDHLPKPMIPVLGVPMIDRTLDRIAEAGIGTAVVNVCYKAEMLIAHLAKRTQPHIIISHEPEQLETGGGIRNALSHFGGEPFLVVNGDILWTDGPIPTLAHLAGAWDPGLDALLLLAPRERAVGYDGKGDFFLEDAGAMRRRGEQPLAPFVFAGVQILHPRLFHDTPEGPFSLNVCYNRAIGDDGILRGIHGVVHQGQWLHIGDPQGLRDAETALAGAAT